MRLNQNFWLWTLLVALSACAAPTPPLQNFCTLYSRTLPDRDEIDALKRPTKEAILANERAYMRECTGRPFLGGQR